MGGSWGSEWENNDWNVGYHGGEVEPSYLRLGHAVPVTTQNRYDRIADIPNEMFEVPITGLIRTSNRKPKTRNKTKHKNKFAEGSLDCQNQHCDLDCDRNRIGQNVALVPSVVDEDRDLSSAWT